MNQTQLLIDACARWYDFAEAPRWYHNFLHASEVAGNILKLTATPSDELIIAAWWHDAVYVPGAGGDANERCSAAALRSEFLKLNQYTTTGYDQNVVLRAMSLIRATNVDIHLSSHHIVGDLAILLDADLGALATTYDDFKNNQECIIIEAGGLFETHKAISANFLKRFLTCRPFIYHTDAARQLWESKAKTNIAQYVDECIEIT